MQGRYLVEISMMLLFIVGCSDHVVSEQRLGQTNEASYQSEIIALKKFGHADSKQKYQSIQTKYGLEPEKIALPSNATEPKLITHVLKKPGDAGKFNWNPYMSTGPLPLERLVERKFCLEQGVNYMFYTHDASSATVDPVMAIFTYSDTWSNPAAPDSGVWVSQARESIGSNTMAPLDIQARSDDENGLNPKISINSTKDQCVRVLVYSYSPNSHGFVTLSVSIAPAFRKPPVVLSEERISVAGQSIHYTYDRSVMDPITNEPGFSLESTDGDPLLYVFNSSNEGAINDDNEDYGTVNSFVFLRNIDMEGRRSLDFDAVIGGYNTGGSATLTVFVGARNTIP